MSRLRVQFQRDARPLVRVTTRDARYGLSHSGRLSQWFSWERFDNGDWWLHVGGWQLWRDSVPQLTVGERGAW